MARPPSSSTANHHGEFESPFSPPHSYGSITLPPLHSITSFAHTSAFLPPPIEPAGPPTSISNPFSLSGDDPQLPSPAPSAQHDVRSIRAPSIYSPSQFSFNETLEQSAAPTIYLDKPIWPLKDPEEALLLRHFVQKLAIWVSISPLAILAIPDQTISLIFVIPCNTSKLKFQNGPESVPFCSMLYSLCPLDISHILGTTTPLLRIVIIRNVWSI